MDNSSFVELWGDDRDAYRYDTFTLYFTDSTGEKLVEEERSVYYKRSLPRERVILEQLIKGTYGKRTLSYSSGEYRGYVCNNL